MSVSRNLKRIRSADRHASGEIDQDQQCGHVYVTGLYLLEPHGGDRQQTG